MSARVNTQVNELLFANKQQDRRADTELCPFPYLQCIIQYNMLLLLALFIAVVSGVCDSTRSSDDAKKIIPVLSGIPYGAVFGESHPITLRWALGAGDAFIDRFELRVTSSALDSEYVKDITKVYVLPADARSFGLSSRYKDLCPPAVEMEMRVQLFTFALPTNDDCDANLQFAPTGAFKITCLASDTTGTKRNVIMREPRTFIAMQTVVRVVLESLDHPIPSDDITVAYNDGCGVHFIGIAADFPTEDAMWGSVHCGRVLSVRQGVGERGAHLLVLEVIVPEGLAEQHRYVASVILRRSDDFSRWMSEVVESKPLLATHWGPYCDVYQFAAFLMRDSYTRGGTTVVDANSIDEMQMPLPDCVDPNTGEVLMMSEYFRYDNLEDHIAIHTAYVADSDLLIVSVSFRGTVDLGDTLSSAIPDIAANLDLDPEMCTSMGFKCGSEDNLIHSGYGAEYAFVRPGLIAANRDVIARLTESSTLRVHVILTGHSQGGGIAQLAAMDAYANLPNEFHARVHFTPISFGGVKLAWTPWLGEHSVLYEEYYQMFGNFSLRVVFDNDWVTTVLPLYEQLRGPVVEFGCGNYGFGFSCHESKHYWKYTSIYTSLPGRKSPQVQHDTVRARAYWPFSEYRPTFANYDKEQFRVVESNGDDSAIPSTLALVLIACGLACVLYSCLLLSLCLVARRKRRRKFQARQHVVLSSRFGHSRNASSKSVRRERRQSGLSSRTH